MTTTPAPLLAFPAKTPAPDGPQLSVVVPMLNEEGYAATLVMEIASAFLDVPHEIIIVDDGSQDGTFEVLRTVKDAVPHLRILRHERNAGQSRAIRTGILAARAPVIGTLDGDGQNPPGDMPALYRQLVRPDAPDALAMVAGERQGRQDSKAKLIASRYANRIRKALLKDEANDTGCGLKVFYRETFLRLPYFDHVHRYLPALTVREGFDVEFRPVGHRPRQHGESKYTNLGRAAVATRDLIGVSWLIARARPPGSVEEV